MLTGRLTLAAAALLACAGASPAAAEFKPTRPIEVVVHGGPGSGNDLFGRAVVAAVEAEKLATVRFQIANKPGGGSTTAANYLMSKDGEAHTIGVFTNIWLTDPLVQAEAKARLHDMTPIARILVEPALVVVRGDSELKTLRDFIDAAKAKPGQMKQSGGSITARENIIRQMLMNNTGARWTFISFPSGGERLAALLGGHVDVMILDPAEAGEQVRTGKLRVIAQVSEQRLDAFMDVPTLKEAGFDIPNVPQTRGIVGPPGMPGDAVAYFVGLLQKVTATPAWQKYLQDNQFEGAFAGPEETRAFLVRYEEQIRGLLKETGAKVVR
ncbi:MAG TPA: tripartite tricarboxylate transporter substrate binding protein [Beijerinckiaceae bacterium]|nr:tripartite tricarboxylate transporter substrate binding protein [Beijerinckiaceae bacterium]